MKKQRKLKAKSFNREALKGLTFGQLTELYKDQLNTDEIAYVARLVEAKDAPPEKLDIAKESLAKDKNRKEGAGN